MRRHVQTRYDPTLEVTRTKSRLISLPLDYTKDEMSAWYVPNVTVTAELLTLSSRSSQEMRTTFNIEVKVDILVTDTERQQAFIELLVHSARMLYGQASMMARQGKPPSLNVFSTGMQGKTNYNVFEGDEFKPKDDE